MTFLFVTERANASTYYELDLTQTGSLVVTPQDVSCGVGSGGSVSLYKVGNISSLSTSMQYVYCEEFVECAEENENDAVNSNDLETETFAEKLMEYIRGQEVSATASQAIGTDGSATFEGLELGIYLVAQLQSCDGYECFTPFVVTLPYQDESGEWIYVASAYPKLVATSVESETTQASKSSESSSEGRTAAETSGQEEAEGGTGGFAQTGDSAARTMVALALALLILGGVVVAISRREKKDDVGL